MALPVLIGCECSGNVRDAFSALGFDAWSCDLKPCEKGSGNHIQGDVVAAVRSRKWAFIGLHPDCTALTVAGNRHYAQGTPGWSARQRSAQWTRELWDLVTSVTKHAYLENPMGVLPTMAGMKHYQQIQPWQFGHGETKKTCLWLHGLPPLMHTSIVCGREQRVWKMPPSKDRKADRSRTYQGIASAMASQWGAILKQECK